MIRRAGTKDVPEMGKLINDCAEYGQMLHRSHAFLYERVRDFHVAVEDERVIGVCGLAIVWANLAELYALAVAPQVQGRGLGRQLVSTCVKEAQHLGIGRIFVLTYEQPFFARQGFTVIDRQQLPLKVWSECVRCLKNQNCDEIAMIHVLKDIAQIAAPQPETPPSDAFIVPVTLNATRGQHRQKMSEAP